MRKYVVTGGAPEFIPTGEYGHLGAAREFVPVQLTRAVRPGQTFLGSRLDNGSLQAKLELGRIARDGSPAALQAKRLARSARQEPTNG